MADAIATGVAVEAAKVAAKLVTARVLDEIKLACGFQDQLVKLQDKLSDIQALLEDLGSAKYIEKSKFVNLWPKKFTDLAYSADELMDDYEYELLRRKIELKNNHPSFKKKCSNYFSLVTNPAVFRVRMSHRVRETLSKFDELYKEAKKNGIQLGQLAREAVASTNVGYYVDNESLHQNRKYAVVRGSEFIGRKSDEEKLLQIIGKDVDRLSTVAIVGIGGVGKTTIARRLYEHDGHFDKKIWICVSEDFKVDRLLNEMVEHLTSSKCDLTNTGALTNNLEQQLKGKKFFLVLDDVWENNQESWDSFRNALLSIGDLRGCVILITTRSIDVAEKARAFYQHKLPGLSEDEGWALLQQRVFSETRPYDSSFNNVGRRIVNKCKGVPLAIKAIGGTLQSKKHPYEWELIENSELWNCQPGDIIDILPSLMLSYNHLNHVYVKQCFAYCAIFPKDYEMEKHQLITLWLAQGFLPGEFATSSSTLTMEMIGENYFNILLNYSFLEEVKNSYGRIVYKMHDLVHDLAAYVSKKYLLVWKDRIKLEDDVSHVRHLVFDLSKNETPSETSTRRLLTRKLRTISFRDNVWINSTLGGARYIRTLIIFDTRLSKVPYIIGQFVHLRYLDLSHSNICKLPESICKFYQLQTLRIMGSGLMYLPRGLYRLENLRHIEASRFLSASGGLRQLTNLQTLPPLELRDGEGWSIDELGPLDQVKGQVNIKGLEHVKNKEAARQAGLGRKDKIVTLHLGWNPYREASHQVINDEDVLESLEPHPNLQSLSVDGFMGVSFPSWMMAMVVKHGGHSTPLTNLKEVTLTDCRKSQQLPTLGQLPFLRILRLEGFNFDIACQSSQVDLISIDFADKLPFRLKLPMVKAAIARGVYFEIMYSSLMQDVQLRRQMISNAKLLVEWTQGKNLIVSSAAPSVLELRGPNDVTNLLSLLGLSNECAKATISKNCRLLLTDGIRTKQFYKEAMRVDLMQPGVQTGHKEPWIVDHVDWDPISSGEGDLFLDDMDKAFAESGKSSKTIKCIDSSSIDDHMPSHGLKLNDTSFRTEGKQRMSTNFTKCLSTSKDLEVSKKTEKLHSEPTSLCSMDQQGNAAENSKQAVLPKSLLACNNDEDGSIYSVIALQELKSSDALETTTSPLLHKLELQDHVNNAENVFSDCMKEIISKDDGLDVGCIAGSRKEVLMKSEGLNCNGLQTDELMLASDVLNSTDAEISTDMQSFDQSYITHISKSSLDGKPLEPQEDSVTDKNLTSPARNVMDLDSFNERNSSDYLLHCDQQPLEEVEEIKEHKGDHTEVKTYSEEFIVADTMLPLDPHQHEKNGNDLLVAKSMFSDDMMKCRKHVQEVGEADHESLGKNGLGNHKVKRRDTGKVIRLPFKRLFQVQFKKKRNSILKTRKRSV